MTPTATDDTLQRCADEPIAVPGAIQPHGALLAVTEPDLAVVVASANADDVLGATPASLADVRLIGWMIRLGSCLQEMVGNQGLPPVSPHRMQEGASCMRR